MNSKFDGNLNKIRREIRDIKDAWKVEVIERKGWTHRYMNFWRTVARKGPVTSATLIGVVLIPATVIATVVAIF